MENTDVLLLLRRLQEIRIKAEETCRDLRNLEQLVLLKVDCKEKAPAK